MTMEFQRQTCRRLHEEHEAAFNLLARLQRALTVGGRSNAPPPGDAQWSLLLRTVRDGLNFEVAPHFDFEERSLFPLLIEAGEGDMVELLHDEHKVIREVAAPFLELLDKALEEALDAAAWQSLKTLGLELCERLTAHAQKEEMALLPALEDALSEETDRQLFSAYASGEGIAQTL